VSCRQSDEPPLIRSRRQEQVWYKGRHASCAPVSRHRHREGPHRSFQVILLILLHLLTALTTDNSSANSFKFASNSTVLLSKTLSLGKPVYRFTCRRYVKLEGNAIFLSAKGFRTFTYFPLPTKRCKITSSSCQLQRVRGKVDGGATWWLQYEIYLNVTLRCECLPSYKLRDAQLANLAAIDRSDDRVNFWSVAVDTGIWATALLVLINDTKEPNRYICTLKLPHVYIIFTETVDYISIKTHLIQKKSTLCKQI
jgi:hypothetical protein